MDAEHNVFGRVLDSCENGAHHPWYNALHLDVLDVWPLHRMSLARACLPVGEDGPVEAIKDA